METNKNIARLKKVQADAKKLKAKNPKLTHIEAVKKAWAMQPKATGSKTKKEVVKKFINDGRKDWQLFNKMPKGWRKDKLNGRPPFGYIFITDGKSILNGGKRGLMPVLEKVGATKFVEKGEPKNARTTKTVVITRSSGKKGTNKKGTFKKFETIGNIDTDFFTRVNNDVNGNPRYVFHFLDILNQKERNFLPLSKKYEYALKKAKLIGGKKYHNKQYGGGIVIQSYNLSDSYKKIIDLKNKTPKIKY